MAAQAQPTPPSEGAPSPTLVELTNKAAQAAEISIDPVQIEVADLARKHRVNSQRTADEAGEMLDGLAKLERKIRDEYDPLAQAAYQSHKMITGRRAAHLKPIQEAAKALKEKLSKWIAEEREKRRLQAEKEAERQREIEERRAAELAEQLEREEGYDAEEAVEVAQQQAVLAPAPAAIARPITPKVKGVSSREVLAIEVHDLQALCASIGEGKTPDVLLVRTAKDRQRLESNIRQYANAFAGRVEIPGVRITKVSAVSRR